MRRVVPGLFAVLALFLVAPAAAQKHEELGRMWTLEDAPLDWFEAAYGFKASKDWLDHVRLSALRFGNGCSASFVSPRGLILTNHHCARGDVARVSPAGENWLSTGFFASSLEQEVKIPGLQVRQLVRATDVTERVQAGESPRDIASAARKEQPELEPQVVALYQGASYRLYQYQAFRDVRLVASPNLQSAKFGGDPDNFTFPRFSLDYALLRAWDGDQPADTRKHYLKWKTSGPQDGDTVFVVGNPGSTGRLNTIAQMEFLRDVQYPRIVESVKQQLAGIEQRLQDAPDDPRLEANKLRMENARKAYQGYLDGLRNDKVMAIKRKAEQAVRARIAASEELTAKFGDAFDELEKLVARKRDGERVPNAEEAAATKRIGEAYFAVYGTEIPPDATFTLRISDGVVQGFPYNGTIAPFFTSLYGLYARHTEFQAKPPFNLPQVWLDRRDELDLTTPFNLVATCDIIGGNSGSPMVDTEGRLIGLVFDGNIEMLGNNFVFTDEVARTVAVHPAIIIESLRKVYDRPKIADELEGKGAGYE